jgi:hypothetical protein
MAPELNLQIEIDRMAIQNFIKKINPNISTESIAEVEPVENPLLASMRMSLTQVPSTIDSGNNHNAKFSTKSSDIASNSHKMMPQETQEPLKLSESNQLIPPLRSPSNKTIDSNRSMSSKRKIK